MELVDNIDTWTVKEYIKGMREPESKSARFIIRKVTNSGLNTFKTIITNHPEFKIEYFLWHYGICAIWEHPYLGLVCTPVSILGYDINGLPNKWKPIIKNEMIPSEIPNLTEDNAVIFYDTMDPFIYRKQCLSWVNDYADVTETIRQQVFNQKTPLLAIAGTKGVGDKLKRAIIDLKNNVKALFVDTDFKDKLQVLDFNAPYNVENLHAYRKTLEFEMLEFCGIDHSAGFGKKERMIVDEQEANDEMLNYILAGCLKARQEALDKLSLFGLSGTTEINDIVRPIEMIEEGVNDDNNADGQF